MADDDTLSPSESTDSDEVRNDDGDTVVDPPDSWSEADRFGMTEREEREGESLEYKLAAEEPELPPTGIPEPERPVRVHRGQIDGAPEAIRSSTSTSDVPEWCRAVSRGIALPDKAIRAWCSIATPPGRRPG
jgi:hypothetical protein